MTADNQEIREQMQNAVENASDIRAEVKAITIKALTERQIDADGIKTVVQAVMDGLKTSLNRTDEGAQDKIKQTVAGLDDALASAAEASKLALEEAATAAKDYSENDLRQAFEELRRIESNFVSTLKEIAGESRDRLGEVLEDFVDHLQNTGTSVGSKTKDELDALATKLQSIAKDQLNTPTEVAKTATRSVSDIARGILDGVSESLKKDKESA